jgi:hypothetical protein
MEQIVRKKGKKTFPINIDGRDVKLYFKNPNHSEILRLDMVYRKYFSLALREGIMSEAEVKKNASKNDVWTKKDEDNLTNISFKIAALEMIVDNKEGKYSKKEIEDAVEQLTKLRTELVTSIGTKVNVVENSAEGFANEQRVHEFVQLCCMIEGEDVRFFEDKVYEDFVRDYSDILSEIYKEAHIFEYGEPDEITSNWSEIKYLNKKAKENKEKQEIKDKKKKKEK